MTNIPMPQLGLTMTEGTIVRWLRNEGERVRKGDPLFEVETDKAVLDVEAPEDGVLLKVLAPANQPVAVGAVVAVVGEAGEAAPESGAGPRPAAASQAARAEAGRGPAAAQGAAPRRKSISPRARKLAEERGIDWQSLPGTGADGQITQQDVERSTQAGQPLPRHRQIIAERLTASLRERAHIHLTVTIDMTEAIAVRRRRPEVSYNALMVKALAACLGEFPAVNSTLLEGTLRRNDSAHIGVAVAAGDDALLVPVIREAEKKTPEQIAAEAHALAEKARAGRLTPDEMTGGTFTLSNLGMYGVEQFTAIINPPETGILAAGAVCDEPRAVNGAVVIRPVCRVTLAVDHRVVDGALAARFLARFKRLMECPA